MDFPQLSIIRPSLITGDRNEFRLGETVGAKALGIMKPLLVGPLKKVRSIPAEQIALAMKVVALHGEKQKVAIYLSDKIGEMQMPVMEEEQQKAEKEIMFNWSKYKREEELPPIDKEVRFDRSKIKEVDREK